MKLLSTEIGDDWIELTFSDNPDTDAASNYVIARVPMKIVAGRPLEFHCYHALQAIQEELRQHAAQFRQALEGSR
jgi:hypothetical protein